MTPPLPSVLITRRMPSAALTELRKVCLVDLHPGTDNLPPDVFRARLAGKQGLICMFNDRVDSAAIDAGDALRVIATVAVGFENIDVEAAKSRSIVVTNTPDILTGATAEFTWALILSVTRRIGEADRAVRSGGWSGWTFDFMCGRELRGKQLGIIGAGRIGRAVAAMAPAFGMHAVFAARSGEGIEGNVLSLDELA